MDSTLSLERLVRRDEDARRRTEPEHSEQPSSEIRDAIAIAKQDIRAAFAEGRKVKAALRKQ